MKWTKGSIALAGSVSETFLPADFSRRGLIVYPHATIDVYLAIDGDTATGSVAAGEFKITSVAGGNSDPLMLLDDDCPTNEIRAYTAGAATVKVSTRSGIR